MGNLYGGSSIDASYQVSVHLVKWFQSRSPLKPPGQMNQNLVGSILGRFSIKIAGNLYGGSSIDASYQVSVHLVKWFQSRRFLEINQSKTRMACGGHVC
jgi:hypothetical protein